MVRMMRFLLLLIHILATGADFAKHLHDKYGDAFREVPEIIQYYGYIAETHYVTSEDGYITALHRIPSDKSDPNYKGPVIVIHPMITSSAVWVISGKNSSLAFLLSNEGYDVWLMNLRGNYYSKGHVSLSPKDPMYWNFSYHESGVYDLPSTIDYILDLTENKNLLCVSLSLGGPVTYVTLSLKPEYNQKIRVHFSLTPGVPSPHAQTILKPIPIFADYFKDPLRSLGFGEIWSKESFDTTLKVLICTKESPFHEFCNFLMFYDQGAPRERIDVDRVPVIAGQLPAGVGVNVLAHIGQGELTGNFAYFDYGKTTNLKVYGTVQPPLYPTEKVVTPTYIYHGADDRDTPPIDVINIASRLGNVIERKVIPGFGHGDLSYGKDADKYIYKPIIETFSQYPIN